LGRLRAGGPDAFYTGEIADEMVKAVKKAGGILTADDLRAYHPADRTPIDVPYRGLRVALMPPPSSGGVALAESLGILAARYPDVGELAKTGRQSSAYLHVLAETMKHAFADRARHLGDADFVSVPLSHLLSPDYHAELARRIKDGRVESSDSYGTPTAPADLHRDGGTTHVSVVDAEGNAVALTTTVNLGFGAKLVAGKTGIVLNDQMDDFAMQPGVPNGFGLIGSAQNAVVPNKRPLSSMTPTIVLSGDNVKLVVGAAGGPTIITATAQTLLNVVDWNMDAQAAVSAARIHHQWFPEVLMVEPDLYATRDVVDGLIKRGHKVREIPHIGVANLIVRVKDGWEAAAEPRSPSAPAGY
jgi:gamma-glutamyltranspeptidase/glutathione hydrolase